MENKTSCFQNLFLQLNPNFFAPGKLDYLGDDDIYEELVLFSGASDYEKIEIPIPEEIVFKFVDTNDQAEMEKLQVAVGKVDEEWKQYFISKTARYFCGYSDNQIASFCILDEMGLCNQDGKNLKIGGPGCVGTVPEFRRKGIGLKMVQKATRILFDDGFDLSWIHYTGVGPWYEKLGYKSVLKWDKKGFRNPMNLLAKGNTAEVYDYDIDKVCKLFWKNYPIDAIQREFSNSKLMNSTDLLTPETFEIVEIEGRQGIVYQKLEGKSLLKELFEHPENGAEILEKMAGIQTRLHKHNSSEIISYKDYLAYFGYTDFEGLQDGNTICHGDFHPDNIIRTKDGQLFLIDFMNLCHGPKEYDIARTYVLITENNPQYEVFGQAYLQMMQVSMESIEPYLKAIRFCRTKEMM